MAKLTEVMRAQAVSRLEEKNTQWRSELEILKSRQTRQRAHVDEVAQRRTAQLAQIGVNVANLRKDKTNSRAALSAYRDRVRPELVGRHLALRKGAEIVQTYSGLQIPGLDLQQESAVGFQTIPPSQGPVNEIRFSVDDSGEGLGWDIWQTYRLTLGSFWFHLVPSRSSIWTLQTLTHFGGFYVLKSDDEAWSSKFAKVKIRSQLSVVQHVWTYGDWNVVFEKEDDNIDETGLIDTVSQLQLQVPLTGGDLAVVYVDTWIEAEGYGGDTYAEVNFADGADNYVSPLALIAWPMS